MFAPITQKLLCSRVGVAIALAAALLTTGCSAKDQPLPAEPSVLDVSPIDPDYDRCPNVDDVKTEQERIDAGLEIVSGPGPEYLLMCLTPAEALAFNEAEMKAHEEKVAQATTLIFGPQTSEELTAVGKAMGALTYYCDHYGDNAAAQAAELVYNANYVPSLGGSHPAPGEAQHDNSFHQMKELACGYKITEKYGVPVPPIVEVPDATENV